VEVNPMQRTIQRTHKTRKKTVRKDALNIFTTQGVAQHYFFELSVFNCKQVKKLRTVITWHLAKKLQTPSILATI
jgi:hypothetical protein